MDAICKLDKINILVDMRVLTCGVGERRWSWQEALDAEIRALQAGISFACGTISCFPSWVVCCKHHLWLPASSGMNSWGDVAGGRPRTSARDLRTVFWFSGLLKRYILNFAYLKPGFFHPNKGKPQFTRQCSGNARIPDHKTPYSLRFALWLASVRIQLLSRGQLGGRPAAAAGGAAGRRPRGGGWLMGGGAEDGARSALGQRAVPRIVAVNGSSRGVRLCGDAPRKKAPPDWRYFMAKCNYWRGILLENICLSELFSGCLCHLNFYSLCRLLSQQQTNLLVNPRCFCLNIPSLAGSSDIAPSCSGGCWKDRSRLDRCGSNASLFCKV